MHLGALPISDLPVWARFNNVSFTDVKVTDTPGRGYGVTCDRALSAPEADTPSNTTGPLITVPHHLVLNATAVEEYAKEDRNFRQLLDAAGHRTPRADILLFLLVQTALASRPPGGHYSIGVSNPWTEYIKFLPQDIPLPTLWTADERALLRGTSLEAAVAAKLSSLTAEFDAIREISSDIPCWNELLWETGAVSLVDWIRLDALYRSRCLELPRSGESMVPCIDMINHSTNASAYYDEDASNDQVVLLLRPGAQLAEGDEVTISYGDAKSAAEMLFSYGFIDKSSTSTAAPRSLILTLNPLPDDPLAKAKLVAFGEAPQVSVSQESGEDEVPIRWESKFAYLMCVNEEDGLEFRVLQETDGTRQLRVFWQGEDVTSRTTDFETLITTHPLAAVLRLRVVTVVQGRLQEQLERAHSNDRPDDDDGTTSLLRDELVASARLLRQIELNVLERGIEALEHQKTSLLADENVVAYLGSMETAESDLVDQQELSNEDDDFS